MQIVIDIDEDVYKKIVADKYAIYDKMFYSIKNGTVLSKGHGRLIDESQITGTFTWDNGYIECFAPTIIEADRSEE